MTQPHAPAAVVAAVVLLTGMSQPNALTSPQSERSELLPRSTTVGHLTAGDTSMPAQIDKSAKGGPAHAFAFTVSEPTEVFARLDCDSCPPHLALSGDHLRSPKVAKDRYSAIIKAKLTAGSYTLWAGTVPTRGGAYSLLVDTDSAPESRLIMFRGVTASYQDKRKTVSRSSVIRLGEEALAVTTNVTTNDAVVKEFKYADIVDVTSATSSSSSPGAAILFGPAFGTSSHQRLITVKTANDYIVLNVPAKTFQVILAEIEKAIRVKKPG